MRNDELQSWSKDKRQRSTEQNKAIVLQFYKAFDNRNIDQAMALLAPNFVAHLAGVPEPLERLLDKYILYGVNSKIFVNLYTILNREPGFEEFRVSFLKEEGF